MPPVKRLAAAGVVLCAGSDGIRDTWGPYGNADMLERATILGLRNNLRRDDELSLALDAVTIGGARALGLEGYGLQPGDAADLVLVEAETVAEAVAQHPGRRTTIKAGRVVAEDGACPGRGRIGVRPVPPHPADRALGRRARGRPALPA